MFKSKKEQLIQTKTEKSDKQIESGKKGKTKSATRRPLLSKFFKNTTKDENKKNKVNDDSDNTIRSSNTTEKEDISEKENVTISSHSGSVEVSSKSQVREVVTHEVTQTVLESSNDHTGNNVASENTGKYETLRRKISGNDDSGGKGGSRSRKSSEESRARKTSVGRKSPKSPSTRKNKKGYPEIGDAELVFTTATYSSQSSTNQSFDSTEDASSPQLSRKEGGNEIAVHEHQGGTITTSDTSEASTTNNKLLTAEPLARGDVKSEDMSALIDMLKDLTDSFGAPPVHDPSYINISTSSPYETRTPTTTPNDRENECRLAWQDEAKELSERLLKKIQEIEITSSKEHIDRDPTQRSLVESNEEYVIVSNVADVESANVIDFDNENNKVLSETSELQTNKNENSIVESTADTHAATPEGYSVVQGADISHHISTSGEVNNGKTTTSVSQSSGVFIFGNKFHSSKHKFQTLEKTVTEHSGTDGHVTTTKVTTTSCEHGADSPESHEAHALTIEPTVVLHQEAIVEQPYITITSGADIVTEASTVNDISSKQDGDGHIIEEQYVLTISSSQEEDKDVSKEEVEPTVVVTETVVESSNIEPAVVVTETVVESSNIELDHQSPDEELESSSVVIKCITDVTTTNEDTDMSPGVELHVTSIHANDEVKERTDDDMDVEITVHTYKHDRVMPPSEITSVETCNDQIKISPPHQQQEVMLVNETHSNHTETINGGTTTISLDINSTSSVEPEALLVKESNGSVIISDVPLKKVEDFSQAISENIIKDSLSEDQLISASPKVTTSSYKESSSITMEGEVGSPLSGTEHTTKSVEVDGVKIKDTSHSHAIQMPELGENVTMDDLMLKYKDYIERSDSIDVTDVLGNIPGLKDNNIDESIFSGDAVTVVDTSKEHIESPTEIIEEHTHAENVQEVESALVHVEGESTDPQLKIELTPNDDVKENGVEHVCSHDASNTDVQINLNDAGSSEVRIIQHSDTDNGHIEEICITNTTVSVDEVDGGTETIKTVQHTHTKKYTFNAEGDSIISPETLIHIGHEKDKHPTVDGKEPGDEIVSKPIPLEISEEIPDVADKREAIESPRDIHAFSSDHTGFPTYKDEMEATIEVDETVVERLVADTVETMVEQIDMLPTLSEESMQDGSKIIERQKVDTENEVETLKTENEIEVVIATTKTIEQDAAPSVTVTTSVLKKDEDINEDNEGINSTNSTLELNDVSTTISPVVVLQDDSKHLHGETSVFINILKTKDQIIDDDGFDKDDIDIQIKRTNTDCTDECEETNSHPETTELTVYTRRERSGSVQLAISVDNELTNVLSKENDSDNEEPEVEKNIDVSDKTEEDEIKQLINEIQDENKHIYSQEHLSFEDQCQFSPDDDSVREVRRRDQLVEQLLIKMSNARKISVDRSDKITALTKQKSFDAEFLISLLNKGSATPFDKNRVCIEGGEPAVTRSEGYIEVNQSSTTDEIDDSRVSELAGIILKQYRTQYEPIHIEIKDAETPEVSITVKEGTSHHPDTESVDIGNEPVIKTDISAVMVEPCVIQKHEDDEPEVKVSINYTKEITTTTSEKLTHDTTPVKTVDSENVDAIIILERKEVTDICSVEPVAEDIVPKDIITEELMNENIMAEEETIIEFPSEMNDLQSVPDESEIDDLTIPSEKVEDAVKPDDNEPDKSMVTTVDIVVESSANVVVCHDDKPVVVEDIVVPTEKPVNVIDQNIEDIGSSEPVTATINIIDVECESTVVLNYEEQEVPVDENPVTPVETTDDTIDLTTSHVESDEPIASRDGQIEVGLQPSIVCYDNHSDVPNINLIAPTENDGDNETSVSILSIQHDEGDKETSVSILSIEHDDGDNEPSVSIVSIDHDDGDNEPSVSIVSIEHDDGDKMKTDVVTNNVIIPTIADEDAITVSEKVDSSIVLKTIDGEEPVESTIQVEHVTVEVNTSVNVNNIPNIVSADVVVPAETDVPAETEEHILHVHEEHVHTREDIQSPRSLTENFDIEHTENKIEIIEISEPSVVEVEMIETHTQVSTMDALSVSGGATAGEVRANLTSSVIIDEDMQMQAHQEAFDNFDNTAGTPACDMITIFKRLRSQMESDEVETPVMPEKVEVRPQENVLKESSVGYTIIEGEKIKTTGKRAVPMNNDLVSEEFVTQVEVSKEESEVTFLEQPSASEKLVPEEDPTVCKEIEVTVDIERQSNEKNEGSNSSPETSLPQNGNGKLKKRPTASFRKISGESNTLGDKIRKSIECDTKPVCDDENIAMTIPDHVSLKEIESETVTCEDEVIPDAIISLPPSTEPEKVETKADDGGEKDGTVEEEKEEEKPLYIVCKDVNQTNIITSSRARIRDDEDGSGISRTPSPGTPMKHSPIVRLTSTPHHDVQSTPTTTINGNTEHKVTHDKRVMVQTQFFYEQNNTHVHGTTINGTVHRHVQENPEQRSIESSNTYTVNTEIVDVPIEELVVANTEALQESSPTLFSDEEYGTNLNKVPDTDVYNEACIDEFMSLLTTTDSGVEPVLKKVELDDEIISQKNKGGISTGTGTGTATATATATATGTGTGTGTSTGTGKWNGTHTDYVEVKISGNSMDGIGYVPSMGNIYNDSIRQHSQKVNTTNNVDAVHNLNKMKNHEENINLLIDNGRLVEQPDDQMYRESHEQNTLQQTITLTSRQLPKYQNVYIEMRSRGEVPVDDDIDPYLSEIHCKDIEGKWQDQGLLSPTYTSFQQVIITNCPKTSPNTAQSVSVVPDACMPVLENDNPSPELTTTHSSNEGSRSSPEVTFNKDLHESLQIFCDGLLTGLFKGNEVLDEVTQPESETTIKINTDLKPIKHMLKEKTNKQEKETGSCRVFKCDEVMLRQELNTLNDGDTTTK